MISNRLGSFLSEKLQDGMISAEKVAHVQIGNNLEHALLVLTKCGYSTIPVLDFEFKLYGLISTALITDAIIGLDRIEYERLESLKVEEAMETNFPIVQGDFDIERVVRLLVDHPFVCVVNEASKFQGILTRKIILKQVNHFMHVPMEEES